VPQKTPRRRSICLIPAGPLRMVASCGSSNLLKTGNFFLLYRRTISSAQPQLQACDGGNGLPSRQPSVLASESGGSSLHEPNRHLAALVGLVIHSKRSV